MKKNLAMALGLTAFPLAVGGLASFLTSDAMVKFDAFAKPPLAPPGWLFPVVWTVLYLLMGMASYLVFRIEPTSEKQRKTRVSALVAYGLQLALNFCWSLVFFGAGMHWLAFGILIIMWLFVVMLVVQAARLDRRASYMLVPYALWTTFAAYLNVMIAILN